MQGTYRESSKSLHSDSSSKPPSDHTAVVKERAPTSGFSASADLYSQLSVPSGEVLTTWDLLRMQRKTIDDDTQISGRGSQQRCRQVLPGPTCQQEPKPHEQGQDKGLWEYLTKTLADVLEEKLLWQVKESNLSTTEESEKSVWIEMRKAALPLIRLGRETRIQPAAKVIGCNVSPKVMPEKVTATPFLMDHSPTNDTRWLGEESALSQADGAASLSPRSSTSPMSREFNALGCRVP